MRRCQIDCEFISELDLFGKEPEFFIKVNPKKLHTLEGYYPYYMQSYTLPSLYIN